MTGFRPKLSDRPPMRGRMAALASAYADPTHVKSSPPFRSSVKVGRIVATAVKSRAASRTETRIDMNDSQKMEPFVNEDAAAGWDSGSTSLTVGVVDSGS